MRTTAKHLASRVGVFVALVAAMSLVRCGDEPVAPPRPAPPSGPYLADGTPTRGTPDRTSRPNLIVILLDTLREDAVAMPDEPSAGLAPNLEAFAKQGVACREAIAPSSWTVPSIATLLTGLLPNEHGAIHSRGTPRMSEAIVSYAEVLRNAYGYETAVFTDAPWLRKASWSLLQGFARGSISRGPSIPGSARQGGFSLAQSRRILDDWLGVRDADRPFCLFLHSYEVHDPYGKENQWPMQLGPEAYRRFQKQVAARDVSSITTPQQMVRSFFLDTVARARLFQVRGREFVTSVKRYLYSGLREAPDFEFVQEIRAGYDGGVRWTDGSFGMMMAYLKDHGLLENTLVVVTSDHGESFAEHGTLGHGTHQYYELTRIPLLMHGPAPFDKPRILEDTVGLIDVMPTFFDWAGMQLPAGVHGRSMLPAIRGASVPPRVVLSETLVTEHGAQEGVKLLLASARTPKWACMIERDLITGEIQEDLYDLEADPQELTPTRVRGTLTDLPPVLQGAMERLRTMVAAQPGPRAPR